VSSKDGTLASLLDAIRARCETLPRTLVHLFHPPPPPPPGAVRYRAGWGRARHCPPAHRGCRCPAQLAVCWLPCPARHIDRASHAAAPPPPPWRTPARPPSSRADLTLCIPTVSGRFWPCRVGVEEPVALTMQLAVVTELAQIPPTGATVELHRASGARGAGGCQRAQLTATPRAQLTATPRAQLTATPRAQLTATPRAQLTAGAQR
jgi:hypothetical protein